jgi:hypothetical protein
MPTSRPNLQMSARRAHPPLSATLGSRRRRIEGRSSFPPASRGGSPRRHSCWPHLEEGIDRPATRPSDLSGREMGGPRSGPCEQREPEPAGTALTASTEGGPVAVRPPHGPALSRGRRSASLERELGQELVEQIRCPAHYGVRMIRFLEMHLEHLSGQNNGHPLPSTAVHQLTYSLRRRGFSLSQTEGFHADLVSRGHPNLPWNGRVTSRRLGRDRVSESGGQEGGGSPRDQGTKAEKTLPVSRSKPCCDERPQERQGLNDQQRTQRGGLDQPRVTHTNIVQVEPGTGGGIALTNRGGKTPSSKGPAAGPLDRGPQRLLGGRGEQQSEDSQKKQHAPSDPKRTHGDNSLLQGERPRTNEPTPRERDRECRSASASVAEGQGGVRSGRASRWSRRSAAPARSGAPGASGGPGPRR